MGTPTTSSGMVRTISEWHKIFADQGLDIAVINAISQDTSILDDMLWMQANGMDGHTTTILNGLPDVYWRRLYKGIPMSKSKISQVRDSMGMLEARSMIDSKMMDMNKGNKANYRMSENKAFIEAMRQKLAATVIYGSVDVNPDGFHGLDPRYAHKDAPNVVDAGGTAADRCTSMWGIVWGEREVHGIFPKGGQGGLKHQALGEQDYFDDEGHAYRGVGDLFTWNAGLSVRDWRCVVRICNIDTTKLELEKGQTGFVDLHRMTIKAKNLIPAEKRSRLKWYCNQDVMTALELQASDAGNVRLTYGDLLKSEPATLLHGCALHQLDAILSTEAPLAAMP